MQLDKSARREKSAENANHADEKQFFLHHDDTNLGMETVKGQANTLSLHFTIKRTHRHFISFKDNLHKFCIEVWKQTCFI